MSLRYIKIPTREEEGVFKFLREHMISTLEKEEHSAEFMSHQVKYLQASTRTPVQVSSSHMINGCDGLPLQHSSGEAEAGGHQGLDGQIDYREYQGS